MGMPFPSGLRRLEKRHAPSVRWAWSLNAAASVLGSASAIFLAIYIGLRSTLLVGAALYLCALLVILATRRLRRTDVVAIATRRSAAGLHASRARSGESLKRSRNSSGDNFASSASEIGSAREIRIFGDRSARVPRADVLADVAAEDVIAHAGAQFLRNRPAQLDGQIRDAAARVQLSSRLPCGHDRVRRTSLDAARAAPAAIRRRRARLEIERRHDLAQKKPRSQRLVNQASVLADPAQPGQPREATLQQRRGIDADLPLERLDVPASRATMRSRAARMVT